MRLYGRALSVTQADSALLRAYFDEMPGVGDFLALGDVNDLDLSLALPAQSIWEAWSAVNARMGAALGQASFLPGVRSIGLKLLEVP